MKALTEFLNEVINSKADNTNRDKVVKWIDENYKCSGLKISDKPNKDGLYEVDARDVEVKNRNITSLTNGMFVWKDVKGNFDCSDCFSLESLKGSPNEIRGDFNCAFCISLKSLEDAPKVVGRDFECCNCGTTFTVNDVKIVSKVKGKIIC